MSGLFRSPATVESPIADWGKSVRPVPGCSNVAKSEPGEVAEWLLAHGLLIECGRICHIVKLPISMIRPFSLVNNSHITLYPQLEIIWKVSKSLRKYWGKYGQISFYIISCITRDCIIVENILLV